MTFAEPVRDLPPIDSLEAFRPGEEFVPQGIGAATVRARASSRADLRRGGLTWARAKMDSVACPQPRRLRCKIYPVATPEHARSPNALADRPDL